MRTVELGTTGEQVSAVALGAMLLGTRTDDAGGFALLDRFAADGGTFLDTADCYAWWERRGSDGGHSEELLGRWFASRPGSRDRTFLSTKGTAMIRDVDAVWPADGGEPVWPAARERFVGASAPVLRRSLEASLRRLGTDHVDLYHVHVDDRSTPLEETLAELAAFVAEGKVRYVGWSNVRAWRLAEIAQLCRQHGWPAPVAVQQQHTYLQRRAGLRHGSIVDDEQLDFLEAHPEITLVAYSPLLKGLYDAGPAERAQNFMLADYAGAAADRRLATVDAVAAETGATGSQVVLAWLLAQTSPRVVPLVGTTRPDRWQQAVAAVDLALTADQLTRLDAS
ncbi:aldo/keto reductase [Cellulomonas sp. 179-A 9B4 NHS]|uniref:aldo/keto reductase n=1 Tax=Cellulomonas sp. 179-A 9B4 NHS TaxID=3142379 RepID=UPI00399F3590